MNQSNKSVGWTRASVREALRSQHQPDRLNQIALAHSPLVRQRAESLNGDIAQALRALIAEAWRAWEQDTAHADAQRAREVLHQHFWEGQSLKEIRLRLNLHDSSVRRALYEGLDALAAILQRWEEALQHDKAAAAAAPACWHGPPPPPLFVGRESLIAQINALIEGGAKGIALHGLGGTGKTTLLAHLIYTPTLRGRFPDGVLWASLGDAPDQFGILGEWGAALGMSQATLNSLDSYTARASALRARLLDWRMVIVLDDVRRREDAEALQVGGSETLYLYSTYSAELAHQLVPGENALHVPLLDSAESLALFQALAPEFAASHPSLATKVAQSCDGIPIVIAWAAHALSVAARAHQTKRIAHLVQAIQHRQVPSEATSALTDALQRHLNLLSPMQRRALYALAVLPLVRGMKRERVLSLCCGRTHTADPEGMLLSLVENGLLVLEGDRFRLHAVVSQALNQANGAEALAARRAMAKRLLRDLLRRTALPQVATPEEISLVRLGVEAGIRLGKPQAVAQLLSVWWELLIQHGQAAWLEETSSQVESQLASIPSDWRYALQAKRATLLVRRGQSAEAKALSEEALARLQEADLRLRLIALTARADVLNYTGDLLVAHDALRQALAIAMRLGNDKARLELLLTLAAVEHNRGHDATAKRSLRTAWQLSRRQRDRAAMLRCLYSLTVVARHQRRYREAIRVGQLALKGYQALGDTEGALRCLTALGIVQVELGNHEAAARYYAQASALVSRFTDIRTRLMLQYAQGVLAMRRGDLPSAVDLLEDGLALAEHHGLSWFIASIAFELGECWLKLRDVPRATQHFERGLSMSQAQGYEDVVALHCYGLSRVADVQGDSAQAWALVQASLAQLERSNHFRLPEVRRWAEALAQQAACAVATPNPLPSR